MTISRVKLRALALTSTLPFAFFGYQALPVAAATPTCEGQAATMVVGSGSAHVVHGTAHRDVVVVKDAGHVVRLGGGADLLCGSTGHDTVFGGAGRDHVLTFAGRDTVSAGAGADEVSGGAGDDDLEGDQGDDVLEGDDGNDDCAEAATTTTQCDDQDGDDQGENENADDDGSDASEGSDA